MNVTLIDSPVANVANIARALRAAGASLHVTRDPGAIATAAKVVLPGVGSFAAAMRWLEETRIDAALREAVAQGAWLLGICVGHQLLFDVSHEMGTTRGLGLVHGEIRPFEGPLPVPQIGWNRVTSGGQAILPVPTDPPPSGGQAILPVPSEATDPPRRGTGRIACPPLFEGVAEGTAFYFVNSYAARAVPSEIATADYNGLFTAAVQHERIFGVQFHPEKSSAAGVRVLRNFVTCN